MTQTPSVTPAKTVPLIITVLVGVAIWFAPTPEGIEQPAWQMFAIFIATIVGIILKPLPMGAVAIAGIAASALTGTLTIQNALSGFANTVVWLIVVAFLIARAFIKSGLGARIGFLFMRKLGKRTLGLAYGLALTDLVLAPAMPSNTARAGGVINPLVRSVAEAYGSKAGDGTERRIGAFLTKSAFQVTVITSAMFMTAMAANPLIVNLASDVGVEITWTGWALAAMVPGVVSLFAIPLLIYLLYPPEIKATPQASEMASERLREMGPMSTAEKLTLVAFFGLLVLWIFGKTLGIHSTLAALVGLTFLLLAGVLTWNDVLAERGAWDTLVWFAALVMMATQLKELGFIPWFGDFVAAQVEGISWQQAFTTLALVYFYSHYLFASQTAHISAMYGSFLAVAVAVGTPAAFAALVLAFFSNLFASITHYASGPAPVLFGSGYVSMGAWWSLGGVISIVNIAIWIGLGMYWWGFIGLL